MKLQNLFLSATCALFLLTGCEQDTVETVDASTDITAQLNLTAKQQAPQAIFDISKKGVYHGVVAHQSTQSRGKVWINLGNNSKYDAVMEMVGGEKLSFKASSTLNNGIPTYTFNGVAGRFDVIMNDLNSPEVTNVTLNNESYFAYVIKSTSANRATSYTGTFNETGNMAFSGTWNILSNGVFGPNGNNGTAVSDVMVTFGNTMFVDSNMETGFFPCFGQSNWVPIVDAFNYAGDGVLAFGQQSSLNGIANWGLGYSDDGFNGFPSYLQVQQIPIPTLKSSSRMGGCSTVSNGEFTWTSAANATVRNGEIYIDVAP